MKVCVPSAGSGGLDDQVGEHFGRVPNYTVVDTETGEVEIVPNQSEHMGGAGLPANLLAHEGVDIMICSGLGRKAINLFESHRIDVHIGASGRVKDAIEQWNGRELTEASESDACRQHKFGKHSQ